MSTLRLKNSRYGYVSNQKYGSLTGISRYCWGHRSHRPTSGGRVLGKAKLWHCAECTTKKEEAK